MSRLKIFLITLLHVCFSLESFSQYFSYGQDPASVRWQEINTENFQVIFQESFGEQGNYVANILEKAYAKTSYSLDNKPKKISVIIHNQNVLSNGFVAPAPNRMELFSTPPQRASITPWVEHLCVHEIRHVVQIDKLNQGVTKVLNYILGEQATGAVAGLIPMWFFEGDAVIAETALGKGGRGRIPSFSKELRVNILDQEREFDFSKMLLGSYKNVTPDHYTLGYHMTSYARKFYGKEIWSDVIDYTARNPFFLASFNLGLKKYTDDYSAQLYKSTAKYYNSLWTNNLKPFNLKDYTQVNLRNTDDYESYRYPKTNAENIVAIKSGYSHLDQFVLIDSLGEIVLHEPGILTSMNFSYSNGKIVWTEKMPDLRWLHRNYSVIKMFDIHKNEETQLTQKTRLYSPALSGDGEKVVAVNISKDNQYSLIVLDTKNGWKKKEFTSLDNMFLQHPVWSLDEQYIYVITTTSEGKAVFKVETNTGRWIEVVSPVFENLSSLSVGSEHLYFHSSWNDVDNIFAKEFSSGKIYRITSSRYGAQDVEYDEKKGVLYFSDYSPQGYNIKKLEKSEAEFSLITRDSENSEPVIKTLTEQERGTIDFNKDEFTQYESSRYRRWKHLFNFHSWAPIYFDQDQLMNTELEVSPGITLLSQNVLSTAFTTLGYSYKSGHHGFHTSFTYKGWYPEIRFSTNYGGAPEVIRTQGIGWIPKTKTDYLDFNLNVSVPLDLSVGRNISRFIPSVEYEYTKDYYYNYQEDYYIRGLKTIDYNVRFFSYRRLAFRDIYPELGLTMTLNARSSPFKENIFGNMFSVMGNLYVPGLFEDHGIKITFGYQTQNPELYLFSGYLNFPRGYMNYPSEKLYVLKGDYVLPLYYPDWSVGSLIYIKRFKADLFYDFASNQIRGRNSDSGMIEWRTNNYHSTGVEVTTDFHLMRVMFPLTAGVRYSYLPTISDYSFEFVFDIDLFSIYNRLNKHGRY